MKRQLLTAVLAAPLVVAGLPAVAHASPLPRARLTPGNYFPRLTAATVCSPGYAATVPAVSVATAKRVFARYHISYQLRARYEVDHLVAVNVGGTNAVTNLWPELIAGANGARSKDSTESRVQKLVCSGRSALHDAQHIEAVNWTFSLRYLALKPRPAAPKPVVSPVITPPVVTPPVVTPPVVAPPVVTPPVIPPAPLPGFGDGTHLINSQMPPGTYVANGGGSCYWQRDSDLSGSLSGIIANDFGSTRPVVSVAASDVAFESSSCGRWTLYTPPVAPVSTFADGTFVVGSDIVAGTYLAPGGPTCYWERVSDLGGTFMAIVANDFGPTSPAVTISTGDVGFISRNCGVWTRA